MKPYLTRQLKQCWPWLLSACCGWTMVLLPAVAWCQPPAAEEPPPERVRPETAELKEATNAFREHLKKMREVLVRYNTNVSGEADPSLSKEEQDRRLQQQWFELERSGLPLHARLVEAALAEYLMDPPNKTAIADMLWRILERNYKLDRYEGMLPVAQALLANNYPKDELLSIATMTAFGLSDFDALRPMLSRLQNDGNAPPQLMGLQQELAEVEKLWQEELAVREQDSQGEPLPRVLMHTTKGDVEIELYENQAPETVGNFIHLIESGFYEGLTFHRVLEHFMAQTGCPTGDGTGGPGYTIYNEAQKPGARKFFRGTLGLALAQNPDTGGSQFFITYLPTYQLNGGYTAFGRVVSGMEVICNIERINPDVKKEEGEPAVIPDEIISIEVVRKRAHEYSPNKVRP